MGKLIVALDVDNLKAAKRLVDRLSPTVKVFKVGSELFTACGPEVIKAIRKKRCKVFLDLKFHDIPNTVAKAAGSAAALGVSMFNVHAQGGLEMMRRAKEAARKASRRLKLSRPKILAVTVLTSIDKAGLKSLGVARRVQDQVLYLAKLAKQAGLDGVVASAREARGIRKACGRKFLIVTPGIRPAGSSLGDQKRVVTPKGAIAEGADYIVVGRPITEARDPVKAAKKILEEIEG